MNRNYGGGGAVDGGETSADELPQGLVIGDELIHPDPVALDEMERKKERILMQSLRRKQQQVHPWLLLDLFFCSYFLIFLSFTMKTLAGFLFTRF